MVEVEAEEWESGGGIEGGPMSPIWKYRLSQR